jgi:hypothetical protein
MKSPQFGSGETEFYSRLHLIFRNIIFSFIMLMEGLLGNDAHPSIHPDIGPEYGANKPRWHKTILPVVEIKCKPGAAFKKIEELAFMAGARDHGFLGIRVNPILDSKVLHGERFVELDLRDVPLYACLAYACEVAGAAYQELDGIIYIDIWSPTDWFRFELTDPVKIALFGCSKIETSMEALVGALRKAGSILSASQITITDGNRVAVRARAREISYLNAILLIASRGYVVRPADGRHPAAIEQSPAVIGPPRHNEMVAPLPQGGSP